MMRLSCVAIFLSLVFSVAASAADPGSEAKLAASLFDLPTLYRRVDRETREERVQSGTPGNIWVSYVKWLGHSEPVIRLEDARNKFSELSSSVGSKDRARELLVQLAATTNDPVHWQIAIYFSNGGLSREIIEKHLLNEAFLSHPSRLVYDHDNGESFFVKNESLYTTGREFLQDEVRERLELPVPFNSFLDVREMEIIFSTPDSIGFFLQGPGWNYDLRWRASYFRIMYDPELRHVRSWMIRKAPDLFQRGFHHEWVGLKENRGQRVFSDRQVFWSGSKAELDLSSLWSDVSHIGINQEFKEFVEGKLWAILGQQPDDQIRAKALQLLALSPEDTSWRAMVLRLAARLVARRLDERRSFEVEGAYKESSDLLRTIKGFERTLNAEDWKSFTNEISAPHQHFYLRSYADRNAAIKRRHCTKGLLRLLRLRK